MHSRWNYQRNEKKTLKVGENNCKWSDQQGINFQNTQTVKKSNQKIDDLTRHFSKEAIQMAKRSMKICSISLMIRKMEIETKMRYDLILAGMAIIKKSTMNVGEGVDTGNPPILLVGI